MELLNNLTNGELLLICLALFLSVLVFPRLIRKRKIRKKIYSRKLQGQTVTPDTFSGKTKLFFTHNGASNEVEELLVKLKTFAFKHEMKIVYPGCFKYHDTISPTTLILAGRFGVLLIRCYGFGGHVYVDPDSGQWMQNMNNDIKVIPSPVQSMDNEVQLMRAALEQTEFAHTEVYAASVFTRQGIVLGSPKGCNVFDRSGFMDWLETDQIFPSDKHIPVKKISEYLVELVKQKE